MLNFKKEKVTTADRKKYGPKVRMESAKGTVSEGQTKRLLDLAEVNKPKDFKHVGSFCVHVYHGAATDTLEFAAHNYLNGCDEVWASYSIAQLAKSVMKLFGREEPEVVDRG